MDGVTILQTIPAYSFPIYLSVLIMIFGCAVIMVGAFASDIFVLFVITIGLIVFVMGLCSTSLSHTERYKVLVDDNVSYNEFISHYKIIDIDGKILTVEEIKGE